MKSFCTGIFTVALLAVLSASAFAQVTVEVGDVDASMFPVITAQVTTKDAGVVGRPNGADAYSITEDGFEQSPVTVDCPIGTTPLQISFIVGQGTGHTQGDVTNAGGIINRMLSNFDGTFDYGSISSFTNKPPNCDPRINDKLQLQDEANQLMAFTAPNYLHDILMSCSASMDTTGAIILFSNGQDNGSDASSQEVTNFVLTRKVKLFFFHMGGGNPPQWLVDLAHMSGGAVSTELGDPADDIIRILRGTPDYCLVSYETNNLCRDGSDRMLHVEVDYKQQTVSDDATFQLAADPSTDQSVTFAVQNATITSGQSGKVTVSIPENLNGQRMYSGTFQLDYDNTLLTIDSVSGLNALAAGNRFSVSPNTSGAEVTVTGVSNLTGTGDLFYVYMHGGATDQEETVSVGISNVVLTDGCLNIQAQSGDVQLLPKSAELTITLNTLTFNWDDPSMSYDPEIQALTANVKNTGDVPISGLTGDLTLPAELKFAASAGPDGVFEKTSLAVDEETKVSWYIKPQPQNKEVTVQAQATVTSTEGASDTKSAYVNIKAATSGNRFSCEGVQVTVENGAYTPSPATVRVVLWGVGPQGGPAGECKIVLPDGITLDGGGSTRQYPQLDNGFSHQFEWNVNYPANPNDTYYSIMFVTQGTGVTPDTCVLEFFVPGLTVASFVTPCVMAPDNVDYNETAQQYEPNPFQVTSYVKNDGSGASDTVWAELVLPAGLEFSAGQTARQKVSDSMLTDDSVAVSWDVVVNLPNCEALTAVLTYRVLNGTEVVFECTKPVRIAERPNTPPSIDSKNPSGSNISVNVGHPFTFQVTTSDADGDPLLYTWRVGGATVGEDSTTSYTHIFESGNKTVVTCTVTDFCGDSTVVVWQITPSGMADVPAAVEEFSILGNYPNPFNPSTTIEYRIPEGMHHVAMELLDTNGKLIRTLFDRSQSGGVHRFELNAHTLPSGTYMVRLTSGSISTTRTIMLVK